MTPITSSYSIIYDQMCGTKDVTSGSSEAIYMVMIWRLHFLCFSTTHWPTTDGDFPEKSLGKPQKPQLNTLNNNGHEHRAWLAVDLVSLFEWLPLSAAKEPFWSYNHRPILAGNCPRFVGGLRQKVAGGGEQDQSHPKTKLAQNESTVKECSFFLREHLQLLFFFWLFIFLSLERCFFPTKKIVAKRWFHTSFSLVGIIRKILLQSGYVLELPPTQDVDSSSPPGCHSTFGMEKTPNQHPSLVTIHPGWGS